MSRRPPRIWSRCGQLAKEAIEVGALGFASSRFSFHKTASGELIPTYDAAQAEIAAIADGVADGGGGLIQFVPDIAAGGYAAVLQQVFEAAQRRRAAGDVHAGDRQFRRPDLARRDHDDREVQCRGNGHRDHRADVPAANRFGHRAGADRQPVRVLPELPRNRRPAAGGAGGRDAQTRSAGTHPGRQACRRRPSAALSGAGVELDLPADRRPGLRAGPVDLHCGAGGRARRQPDGGGLRPAARRRRPRHAAGGNGQLREQLARHGRRVDPSR